jgi:sec-independent protein translocase protein TatA
MGLENPIHIFILLIVLLLVFGAKRLPEMGRSLGDGMRGFKESLNGTVPHDSLTAVHAPGTDMTVAAAVPGTPMFKPAPAVESGDVVALYAHDAAAMADSAPEPNTAPKAAA